MIVTRFAEVPLLHHPLAPFRQRVWAQRQAVAIADRYYLVLCRALQAPLLTTDDRLARGTREQFELDLVDLS